MDRDTQLLLKARQGLRREIELEELMDEFLRYSGGSYDMDKFDEWFKKRLYK